MADIYNIYCDESCHLEHDSINVMALGAVWLNKDKVHEVSKRINEIKHRNGLKTQYELKWSKISPAHSDVYIDVVDYFFDDNDLHFRGVVIPDKAQLKHDVFEQNHDIWYYKMFFVLLKVILDPDAKYNIYMDYKDTNGTERKNKLHEVLSNNYYDFSREIIQKIQLVKSHQVALIQVVDLFVGALTYLHREIGTNAGKLRVIDRILERSEYSLRHTTLYKESKMNLLIWRPSEAT